MHSFDEAVKYCIQAGAEKMFVLGGAQLYATALPRTDEMIITYFPEETAGDTYFPSWNESEWQIVDSNREEGLTFSTYQRKRESRNSPC